LERWLSDHDVPYPKAADRKDLENLVKSNWDTKVQQPIGKSADATSDSFASVKDWVFDRYQLTHFSESRAIGCRCEEDRRLIDENIAGPRAGSRPFWITMASPTPNLALETLY
jgi:hypothetical protein